MEWIAKLNPSEQAAWVQAVGSVGAILVAVAVPAVAGWRQRKAKKEERIQKGRNSILVIYPHLKQLQGSLATFVMMHDPDLNSDDDLINNDPHEGDFQKAIPNIMASVPSLGDMPDNVAEALRDLITGLIDLDQWMQSIPAMQKSGFHSYWINNKEFMREDAMQLKQLADKAIDAASKELRIKN